MSTAQQVFLAYGTVILIVGFSLGSILGMIRMNMPSIRTLAFPGILITAYGVLTNL